MIFIDVVFNWTFLVHFSSIVLFINNKAIEGQVQWLINNLIKESYGRTNYHVYLTNCRISVSLLSNQR